ncbi:MAG: cell division protein ZapD [Limnobacter sp.]|nr:cell division protein ZapD [Limnobacter sp.]
MTTVVDKKTSPAPVSQFTTYEFPLNERIRTLLRLEDLFLKFDFYLHQEHKLDHHSALLTLFEIIEVGSRADLKSDLIQELERQRQSLSHLQEHPGVDNSLLRDTLLKIDKVAQELSRYGGRLGHHLRDNEFLTIIRSRCSIPGGVCEFDLPSYRHWQCKEPAARRSDIQLWFEPMKALSQAAFLVLRILRESGEYCIASAENGNFTQQMTGKSFQLLRVDLPVEHEVVPEFSANKYMLWIRFNTPGANGVCKNNPYTEAFDFRLQFCNL